LFTFLWKMKELVSRESGRVLLLKIQDEGDVSIGVKILKGELSCKYDTIQFAYDEYDYNYIDYAAYVPYKFRQRLDLTRV